VGSGTWFVSLLRRRTIRKKSLDVTQAIIKHACSKSPYNFFIYLLVCLFIINPLTTGAQSHLYACVPEAILEIMQKHERQE
jgi:hypothetical protein